MCTVHFLDERHIEFFMPKELLTFESTHTLTAGMKIWAGKEEEFLCLKSTSSLWDKEKRQRQLS